MFIPYGRQYIDREDLTEVDRVLLSDWLTQGPRIAEFEQQFAEYCGARYAVAVANGTAALHIACLAAGYSSGELITSPITFVASANCGVYCGLWPKFADIDPVTVTISVEELKYQLTPQTKIIIPVHFSGYPCDMPRIYQLAQKQGITVIEDAAHALGAAYRVNGEWIRIGSCRHSHMTIFSFHPVKHITTGEGGMVTTNDPELHQRLLFFRNHGITRDCPGEGGWYYEMRHLGFNYRLTDIQCALGLSQLRKLDGFLRRRREIVQKYVEVFRNIEEIDFIYENKDVLSAWHLFVIKLRLERLSKDRRQIYELLRQRGIGVNVHYIPVHLQPFYREKFGYKAGDFPKAEDYYQRAITLPLYPGMHDQDVDYTIASLKAVLAESKK